jgi:hypothetical protein
MGEYKCKSCNDTGYFRLSDNIPHICNLCEIGEKTWKLRDELLKQPKLSYYHNGIYEAINVIEAWGLNFCLGNVIKYVARAGRKTDNPIEDLEKAKWYIEREIEKLKGK